jgi:hypothetical protein
VITPYKAYSAFIAGIVEARLRMLPGLAIAGPSPGHKTMSVFKRYNTVSREELKALVGVKMDMIDTYMDT